MYPLVLYPGSTIPPTSLPHSSCLESLCGDFLHIAVLFIGAIRRSRDYYTDNQNLRRYVCTTSTCNATTCYDGNFTPLDPLWGQLTSPGGKMFSATCQDGNLLQSSASESSCPLGPSGGLVHLLRWELPPNLSHLPSEKSFQHQPLKIKRIDLVLKTVN